MRDNGHKAERRFELHRHQQSFVLVLFFPLPDFLWEEMLASTYVTLSNTLARDVPVATGGGVYQTQRNRGKASKRSKDRSFARYFVTNSHFIVIW